MKIRTGDIGVIARRAVVALTACALASCSDGAAPSTPAPTGAPPPSSTSDTLTSAEASRFLMQATFGPTEASINELVSLGYSEWMRRQLALTSPSNVDAIRQTQARFAAQGSSVGSEAVADLVWNNVINDGAQLRERMAYALSQILVISYEDSNVRATPAGVAYYMDVLNRNAFGNYRTLLEEVTYSPSMAQFLTYLNNRKEDPSVNRVPDENYARELMQLFTIGLVELNIDGTPRLDSGGDPIETYTNDDITGLAKVFTGLSWDDGRFGGEQPDRTVPTASYSPLAVFPEWHSTSATSFLGASVPAGSDAATAIGIALDTLFQHDNIAPFVSKQLIQRFVTSNPSPQYVANVTAAFETGWYALPDGSTVGTSQRGDLSAVIAAVLLDDEARNPSRRSDPTFGKVREPFIRFVHWARNAELNSTGVLGENGLNRNYALINVNASSRLSQQPFRSPSVFNFYRPGYVSSGSQTASANLVAPELQITTTASVLGYANFMTSRLRKASTDQSFIPSYSAQLSLADNATALVDHLDLTLTAGAMSATTRNAILAVVNDIPVRTGSEAEDRRRRVIAANLMAVLSPEFYVQR